MDVKSAFLNGYINEDVYVDQPPGFEDHKYPNCTDQVVGSDDVAASDNIGVLSGTLG